MMKQAMIITFAILNPPYPSNISEMKNVLANAMATLIDSWCTIALVGVLMVMHWAACVTKMSANSCQTNAKLLSHALWHNNDMEKLDISPYSCWNFQLNNAYIIIPWTRARCQGKSFQASLDQDWKCCHTVLFSPSSLMLLYERSIFFHMNFTQTSAIGYSKTRTRFVTAGISGQRYSVTGCCDLGAFTCLCDWTTPVTFILVCFPFTELNALKRQIFTLFFKTDEFLQVFIINLPWHNLWGDQIQGMANGILCQLEFGMFGFFWLPE